MEAISATRAIDGRTVRMLTDLRGAHDPMDRAASRPTRAGRPRFRWPTRRRHTNTPGVVPAPTASPEENPWIVPWPAASCSLALAIGVLADIALDGPAFGLNLPLLTAAMLAAAWLLRRPGRAPDPLDAWLPVSALVLAAFVAVRADPFVTFLDIAGAAVFMGASVAAFSGLAVTRRSATRRHGHGRLGARGRGCRSRPCAACRATGRDGRSPARSGLVRACGTRAHPGGPARADLRGPVRLGRSDLQPRFPGRDALPHRSRRPAGPGDLRAGDRLAGRRPADRRGPRPSGAGTSVAGCRGPFRVRDPRAVARHDRGARRPRRDRSHRRTLRRPAARVPVRWARHAGRRRHEVQRLRAARVLRARRSRRAGGRHPGRASNTR